MMEIQFSDGLLEAQGLISNHESFLTISVDAHMVATGPRIRVVRGAVDLLGLSDWGNHETGGSVAMRLFSSRPSCYLWVRTPECPR